MPQRTPIDALLDKVVWRCTLCNSARLCQCWEDCSCGWTTQRGTPCRNPDSADCSTKLKYGTPAQQAEWFDRLGKQVATRLIEYIDTMYPTMWENVSKTGARASMRSVIRIAVAQAIKMDRNANAEG